MDEFNGRNAFSATVATREVHVEALPDGGWSVRSPQSLGAYQRCVGDVLEHWARSEPNRIFLAERDGPDSWRTISYLDACTRVQAIAQGLLERRLDPARPILTLSRNSIDHGLMILAAMHAGIPVVPVAPAYALAGTDLAKLRHVFSLIDPQVVYADDADRHAAALNAVARPETLVVTSGRATRDFSCVSVAAMCEHVPDGRLRKAFAAIGPDTVGKILMTSGSTGMPKGVINTQRMLCSNMQAVSQVYHYWSERPPVQLSWLPWNHTAGGNHVFHTTIWHGGSLYIDEGRPVAGQMEKTLNNLRDPRLAVTSYMSVPLGYAMLLPHLEAEPALRDTFFKNLRYLGCAGAGIPRPYWERLQQLAMEVTGTQVLFGTNWGATETGPTATAVYFATDRPNNIGLPIPGVDLRMVPSGDKLELRLKSPFVTPGYWRQPELTQASRDEEGYYRTGDAAKFVDPEAPAKGIQFDGRVAEDFKLLSGTWVSVGALRLRVIQAAAPFVQDAVVTGHDREQIGLLLFPSEAACRSLCADPEQVATSDLVRRTEVRERIQSMLARLAAESSGSSIRPTRAILLADPPQADRNEITDKGYLNQRAVLMNRDALVQSLYAEPVHADVLLLT